MIVVGECGKLGHLDAECGKLGSECAQCFLLSTVWASAATMRKTPERVDDFGVIAIHGVARDTSQATEV